MLKKVLIGLGGVLAILLVVIATRPAHFVVKRSAVINAPVQFVYAQVNDFKLWQRWSPWEGLDPALQRSYSGPASGVGATYGWVGNDQVGEGRMTITEATTDQHIKIDLEFLKPFAARNRTDFTFSATPEGTQVAWEMSGDNDFMGKAFGLLMDMDNMVGGDFDKGLAQLKVVAESSAKAAAAATPAALAEPDAGTLGAAGDAGPAADAAP